MRPAEPSSGGIGSNVGRLSMTVISDDHGPDNWATGWWECREPKGQNKRNGLLCLNEIIVDQCLVCTPTAHCFLAQSYNSENHRRHFLFYFFSAVGRNVFQNRSFEAVGEDYSTFDSISFSFLEQGKNPVTETRSRWTFFFWALKKFQNVQKMFQQSAHTPKQMSRNRRRNG